MSLTADQIVDRRSLRRKLSFWRVIAFLALAAAVVAAIIVAAGGDGLRGLIIPQIARVTISGFITEDRDQIETDLVALVLRHRRHLEATKPVDTSAG